MFIRSIIFIFFIIISSLIQAQPPHVKWIGKGNQALSNQQYVKAISLYKKALMYAEEQALAPENLEGCFALLGSSYWRLRNYDSAYFWYNKLSGIFLERNLNLMYRMAELHAMQKNYPLAAGLLSRFPEYQDRVSGFRFISDIVKKDHSWMVKPVDAINTPYFHEVSPMPWGNGLLWSTNLPYTAYGPEHSDLDGIGHFRVVYTDSRSSLDSLPSLYAYKPKTEKVRFRGLRRKPVFDFPLVSKPLTASGISRLFQRLDSITRPIVELERAGMNIAQSVFHQPDSTFYFSRASQSQARDAEASQILARMQWKHGTRNDTEVLFPEMDTVSMMYPAISPDGRMLVFSIQQMEDKNANLDLFVSEYRSEGWSRPRLLKGVNSPGNEVFPAFGPDGLLYFSSNGRVGMGGMDVYSCRIQGNLATDVQLMPEPINSSRDDYGFYLITEDGQSRGYLTSNRRGSDDIFRVQKISTVRPHQDGKSGPKP